MPIEISWGIFAQSLSILMREGLEALLVLAALVAYLNKSGAGSRVWAVFAGAIAGVALSIIAAILLELFFEGENSNVLQGVSFLIAAGLMVYVSGWLFIRQDPRAWQAYLRNHAEQALTSGNVIWAIGLLSCLSVLREGAETALFYHALARSENGWSISIFSGIGSATVLLGLIFAIMQAVSVRIPLRPLFIVTSAFLLAIALKFIGNGLTELQEIAIVPNNLAQLPEWWEDIGLNPSWEALGAQAIVLLGVVATFTALHFRAGRLITSGGR
jgi:high-affinity iron transporter